ncbi:hypothetical protein ACFFOM_13235 [Microlunatus capsulatus]|uniref:Uncharacterized protein n=1 Tax=Microlunatus capsulatus TaxID=99117 RepID=A0ABS4Z8F6_9ACTN|nr:hypothetical protein [Microlunatus capsulatus]MBP2417291.1 hypothetical protein [Microlunatus capsulatus]
MRVRRSRLVAVVAAVACVALAATAVQVSEAGPEFEEVRGVVGAPVAVEDGEVLVEDVRVGTRLTRSGEVMDTTPGVFVVLAVTVRATGSHDILYSDSRLLTRGERVYDEFSTESSRAAPGFAERSDYVFEVDPLAVDDLTLELRRLEIISGFQQRVRIHLGITPANAAAWRDAAAGRSVEVETTSRTEALR